MRSIRYFTHQGKERREKVGKETKEFEIHLRTIFHKSLAMRSDKSTFFVLTNYSFEAKNDLRIHQAFPELNANILQFANMMYLRFTQYIQYLCQYIMEAFSATLFPSPRFLYSTLIVKFIKKFLVLLRFFYIYH